jgi:hypothetical protein
MGYPTNPFFISCGISHQSIHPVTWDIHMVRGISHQSIHPVMWDIPQYFLFSHLTYRGVSHQPILFCQLFLVLHCGISLMLTRPVTSWDIPFECSFPLWDIPLTCFVVFHGISQVPVHSYPINHSVNCGISHTPTPFATSWDIPHALALPDCGISHSYSVLPYGISQAPVIHCYMGYPTNPFPLHCGISLLSYYVISY